MYIYTQEAFRNNFQVVFFRLREVILQLIYTETYPRHTEAFLYNLDMSLSGNTVNNLITNINYRDKSDYITCGLFLWSKKFVKPVQKPIDILYMKMINDSNDQCTRNSIKQK